MTRRRGRRPRGRSGAFDGLELRLVMSHLACADEADNPANEVAARELRDACAASCRTRRRRSPIRRASSSGSIPLRPRAAGRRALRRQPDAGARRIRCDRSCAWRRRSSRRETLRPMSASATGMTCRAAAARRLATISLGYADGWPRQRGGMPRMRRARNCPSSAASRWTASCSTFRHCLPGGLKSGDLVELIGSHRRSTSWRRLSGTIGYEILTGLGRRFHRRYEAGLSSRFGRV